MHNEWMKYSGITIEKQLTSDQFKTFWEGLDEVERVEHFLKNKKRVDDAKKKLEKLEQKKIQAEIDGLKAVSEW